MAEMDLFRKVDRFCLKYMGLERAVALNKRAVLSCVNDICPDMLLKGQNLTDYGKRIEC